MSEWKEYTLRDIATLNYGKALKESERIPGVIPVYSSAGLTGSHNQAFINSKGIIVGRKGTIGKIDKSETPFCCIDTAYCILPDDAKYDFDFSERFAALKAEPEDQIKEESRLNEMIAQNLA